MLSTETAMIFGLVDTLLDSRFGLLGLFVSTTSSASTGSASSCDTTGVLSPETIITFGFLVTFLDTRFGLLGLVVSTTSSVSSLGGTYITCSTAV
ncbi:MAG: hypothetical protein ACKPKO_15835, partial [Candidatus Fonsibacter sp.]